MKKPPLIGYYGYWVALTYLSVLSAVAGIYFAFAGYIGYAIICMMFSGLCDTFDGRVASLKERNAVQINFGIQIDAMADFISFGALPAAILFSLGQSSGFFGITHAIIPGVYVLAAFIRLAYFTATEAETADGADAAAEKELRGEDGKRKYFEGLPTTSVALLIPLLYFLCNAFQLPFFTILSIMLAIISILFVLRVRIPKPSVRTQIILCLAGLIILIIMRIISGDRSG